MYLKELMQGEKYAFYAIVKRLVSIDENFSAEEQALIDGFLAEMNLEKEQIKEIPLEEAIKMFSFSTSSVRKKVFLELVGVSLCDKILHKNEEEFLDSIAKSFSINEKEKEDIIQTVDSLLDIYKRMTIIVSN